MANPLRLVMIRHGESESNVIQKAQKQGEKSEYEDEVSLRVDWKQRLSDRGREQARIASREIRKIYGGFGFFDEKYVSPFIRARETAVEISRGENFNWKIDDRLSERIWGIYGLVPRQSQKTHFPMTSRLANDDPWYIRYDGGESLFDVFNRFKSFRFKLWNENSGENVLVVAHKQLIQTACYDIEKLLPEDWEKIWDSPKYDIPNLGLVEFSRVNPFDARDVRDDFSWRRIINLADRRDGEWLEKWEEIAIEKDFNIEELQAQISYYQPIIDKKS